MRRLLVATLCLAALAAGCAPSSIDRGPVPGRPILPVPVAIWSTKDLPAGLDQRLAALNGVRWVSRVSVGMLNLIAVQETSKVLPARANGAVLPISITAMDPVPGDPTYAAISGGFAVVSRTAAQLRGLHQGSVLTVGTQEGARRAFRVGAVVADEAARSAELIVPLRYASELSLTATRGLITSIEGDRAENALRAIDRLTAGVPVRIRAGNIMGDDPSEGPILPFADVKRIFGEFTFTPGRGLFVRVDRVWTDANIVKTAVPLLGLISCNKRLLPQLVGAMRELQSKGLGSLVRTFNGCFSPRMQVGNSYALSRHAFGIAVDINAGKNRFGEKPSQDSRLVAVMERWGFTWGGRWLVPDGMHFEFVRFVSPNG